MDILSVVLAVGHIPDPWHPNGRTPNSGLQNSNGVGYKALRWIYFLDPPGVWERDLPRGSIQFGILYFKEFDSSPVGVSALWMVSRVLCLDVACASSHKILPYRDRVEGYASYSFFAWLSDPCHTIGSEV